MKYLIAIAIILNFMGCANTHSLSNSSNFVVKGTSNQYEMKYHFILETRDKISDMHNPFTKFILITHYHIYTNTLGRVSGDKILFAEHDNTQPKPLSKSSTFIFAPSSISIEGLQWCATVYPHCEKILNDKYLIKDFSELRAENYAKEGITDKGYYK